MEEAHREGLRFAVDCDLKRFFDTVHHALLMERLSRRTADRIAGLFVPSYASSSCPTVRIRCQRKRNAKRRAISWSTPSCCYAASLMPELRGLDSVP